MGSYCNYADMVCCIYMIASLFFSETAEHPMKHSSLKLNDSQNFGLLSILDPSWVIHQRSFTSSSVHNANPFRNPEAGNTIFRTQLNEKRLSCIIRTAPQASPQGSSAILVPHLYTAPWGLADRVLCHWLILEPHDHASERIWHRLATRWGHTRPSPSGLALTGALASEWQQLDCRGRVYNRRPRPGRWRHKVGDTKRLAQSRFPNANK